LTYNFATAITEITTDKLQTMATALLIVSSFQNCDLKQESCTQATALHQPLKFHNCERMSIFTFSELGWNCSEIVVSGRIFVLTLNKQLVLAYNFATAFSETTSHKL